MRTMRNQPGTAPGRGLSRFLICYLLMLSSVLLALHGLQPARQGPGSSSRSPAHQERQRATRPAVLPQPEANQRQTTDRATRAASDAA